VAAGGSVADGQLFPVLGLLDVHLLLLHGHLLTLKRKALLLGSSCNLSLFLLLPLGPSSSTHGSVLVLLLKINGPQHAHHLAAAHCHPDLSIRRRWIRTGLRVNLVQTFDQGLINRGEQVIH
jgi:hypothetical protein